MVSPKFQWKQQKCRRRGSCVALEAQHTDRSSGSAPPTVWRRGTRWAARHYAARPHTAASLRRLPMLLHARRHRKGSSSGRGEASAPPPLRSPRLTLAAKLGRAAAPVPQCAGTMTSRVQGKLERAFSAPPRCVSRRVHRCRARTRHSLQSPPPNASAPLLPHSPNNRRRHGRSGMPPSVVLSPIARKVDRRLGAPIPLEWRVD